MTASFPPIDPATISGLNAGEDRALEQIFRAHYPALLERAIERLSDEPASAPRLVAAAVRELWEEREGFHTSAEIEAFFNEELRQRARALRARLGAVHRFEKNEGVKMAAPPVARTVDQVWADIAAGLHAPVVDAATVARTRREHAKHDAAEHIAAVATPRTWKGPVALVGIAVIVAIVLFVWMNQTSKEEVVNRMLAAAETDAISTRQGQLGSLALPDGSSARLGAESRLVVVAGFGRRYRSVVLRGTGSFTVAPGGAIPFEVRLGDGPGEVVVIATGGALSVRDYADDMYSIVRADDGEAQVRAAGGRRTLGTGEAVIIDRDGGLRDASADDVMQAFAWVDGRMILRDATVGRAAQQLWRWYGMDVSVADSVLAERRLSIDVSLESSQAAIAAIEGGANLRFAYQENKMIFRDAGGGR